MKTYLVKTPDKKRPHKIKAELGEIRSEGLIFKRKGNIVAWFIHWEWFKGQK